MRGGSMDNRAAAGARGFPVHYTFVSCSFIISVPPGVVMMECFTKLFLKSIQNAGTNSSNCGRRIFFFFRFFLPGSAA